MASGRIKGLTIEINGDSTKLTKALSEVDKSLKQTQTNLKDVDKLLKLDPGNVELLRQKQQLLTDAISQTKDRLSQLKDAQSQIKEGSAEWDALQREIIETEQNLSSLEDGLKDFGSISGQQLKQVGDKFKELGDKIKAVGEKVKGVGDKMQDIGKNLTAKVTAPIIGALGASAKSALEFEDAMAKVSTIADTSQVSIEDLTSQITNLSNETGIAATDIADNVYNAISAGQDTGNAVSFVGNATKLAAAGFTDSASALDVLTTTLNAYGMEAKDATKVSDILIQTQNMGKTTVGELAGYMGKVIPTAKGAGVEVEQVAAAYAKLTANGIKTADSTTYLNSMMNELNKSGTKVSNALQETAGKSFPEMMKEGKTLADVLDVLQEAADKSGVQFSDMWSSSEAGKAAAVIHDTTNKLGDFNAAVGQMKNAGDATDEAFKKMNTTSRQAQIALNQIKNSAIELGNTVLTMVAPYFEQFVTKIKDVTTWFNNLDESQKQTAVKIAAIVAAVGPVLLIFGKLITGIGGLIEAVGVISGFLGPIVAQVGGLSGVLAALTGPIGIVIAAITALVGAFVYFYNTNEEFRNKVNEVFAQAKEIILQFVEGVKAGFQQFLEFCRPIFEALGQVFSAMGEAFGAVVALIVERLAAMAAVIQAFISTHQTEIQAFITAIQTVISTKIEIIRTIITTVLNVITNLVKAFTAVLRGDWDAAWKHLQNATTSAKNGIVNIIKSLVNMVTSLFGDLIEKFKSWGRDMIDGLIEGIKEKIEAVKEAIGSVANAIAERIHFSEPDVGPLSDFHTYAPDMMKLFAQGIKDNAHLITDAIGSSFDLRPYINNMTRGINSLNTIGNNLAANQNQQQPVVVQVSLQGDAQRLFNVLSQEAHKDWQITGKSRLMGY